MILLCEAGSAPDVQLALRNISCTEGTKSTKTSYSLFSLPGVKEQILKQSDPKNRNDTKMASVATEGDSTPNVDMSIVKVEKSAEPEDFNSINSETEGEARESESAELSYTPYSRDAASRWVVENGEVVPEVPLFNTASGVHLNTSPVNGLRLFQCMLCHKRKTSQYKVPCA